MVCIQYERSQWWTGATEFVAASTAVLNMPNIKVMFLSYAQNHYSVDKLDPERNNSMQFSYAVMMLDVIRLRGMW